ncbi:MAG TPA: DUF3048 domain-containing protein [Cellulomonas sp.]
MVHARTRSRGRLGALGVVLALMVAGCSAGGDPTSDASTTAATITADKAAAPDPVLPTTWPLTGVAGDVVERPALAVKVENTNAARPQSGLEQADVVWETIVEFDVSRFVAVYQSQVPETIGPVRSVRPMDTAIVSPLNGLLAFSGGQTGILALVDASTAQPLSFDAGVDGLARVSTRSAPHNVYADPEVLWAQADADHQSSPDQQFAFALSAESATAVTQGTPATTLDFYLSTASEPHWTWDGSVWQRYEGDEPAMAASGVQLSAVNVVSIVAEHPGTEFGAQNDAVVPTYTLVGSGEATIATGGQTIAVTWKKDSETSPMQLFLADGTEALLAPGNTWVELVPAGTGTLTIS